jgi:hypothetical protein
MKRVSPSGLSRYTVNPRYYPFFATFLADFFHAVLIFNFLFLGGYDQRCNGKLPWGQPSMLDADPGEHLRHYIYSMD